MSGFNQTGCSKQEIFLTEVTFICVLKSDDLPYHGIYYSFSKIFINFHYILYIYIIYIYNIDDPTYVRSLGVAIWSYLHPSISTALMRPRRPKQYCLQLVIHIYIYIYISVVLTSVSVFYHFLDSYRLKLVSIYLSVFVFLFIKERNLTRLKRPYLSSVLCLSRVRERSLVYGDFQT